MEARDRYPHVIVPRPPYRVFQIQSAVFARFCCFLPRPPFCLLVFVEVCGFFPLRNRRSPRSCQPFPSVCILLGTTVTSLIYPRHYIGEAERTSGGWFIPPFDGYPEPIVSPVGVPLYVFHGAFRVSDPNLQKRNYDGLKLAPDRPRTVLPLVVADGPFHANLNTCSPPLPLLHSATHLSFRLGWWRSC